MELGSEMCDKKIMLRFGLKIYCVLHISSVQLWGFNNSALKEWQKCFQVPFFWRDILDVHWDGYLFWITKAFYVTM